MANLYQAREGVSIEASAIVAVRPLFDPTSSYSTEIVANGGAGAHTNKSAAQIVAELAAQGHKLTLLNGSEAVDLNTMKGLRAWDPPTDGPSKFSFTGIFIAPDTGTRKEVWLTSPFDTLPRDGFYEARPGVLISASDIAAIRPNANSASEYPTEILSIGGVGAQTTKSTAEIVAELSARGEKLTTVGSEAIRDWVVRTDQWKPPAEGTERTFNTTVLLRNPANGQTRPIYLAALQKDVDAAVKTRVAGPVRNDAVHPKAKPPGRGAGSSE
jgi:hypothetical protein